jgi:hypothetical protein
VQAGSHLLGLCCWLCIDDIGVTWLDAASGGIEGRWIRAVSIRRQYRRSGVHRHRACGLVGLFLRSSIVAASLFSLLGSLPPPPIVVVDLEEAVRGGKAASSVRSSSSCASA